MPDGFQPGRAAEPFAGVFNFVGGHGRAFQILSGYTVNEAGRVGECWRRNATVFMPARRCVPSGAQCFQLPALAVWFT